MKTSRYSESQIMNILKQVEAGVAVSELCREHGMSSASFYKWRSKYGGMGASMMARMKELEAENSRLKRMYAEECLIGNHGEVDIEVPRDRDSRFEPQLIEKGQSRLTHFDDQVIALYSKGMSTRDIVAAFKEMYDAEVSASLISKVTDAVIERVVEWQNRPLGELYPIVYMDCIRVKVRQDKRVINKAVYIALGINLNGEKEVLGL